MAGLSLSLSLSLGHVQICPASAFEFHLDFLSEVDTCSVRLGRI